jgi:hypothetical protein
MNERLFELIEETVAIYMKRNLNGTVPQRDYLFQEIFTELIIQECVKIVAETAVDDPPNDLFYGYNLAIGKSVENIKEHFGVKE